MPTGARARGRIYLKRRSTTPFVGQHTHQVMRTSISPAVLIALLGACARTPAPAGLEALRAPGGVIVAHRVETYPVTGADRQTIRAQLRLPSAAAGVRSYAGYYEWHISWRYETRAERDLCRVSRATVTLSSTVTIPEWTPPVGVDSSLVADWKHFRDALAVHEQGHRELAYAGAGRVQRALEKLPVQLCASLASTARSVADPLIGELRLQEARYDRDTRHGFTQGATW